MPLLRPGIPAFVLLSCLAASPRGAQAGMRTGMVEAGARVWSVERTTRGGEPVVQTLTGLSVGWFYNDNISLGVEASTFASSPFGDSLALDARARLYWTPLSRWSPWTALSLGGAFGMPEGNATRYGGALGIRWIPATTGDHLAIDLQLVGVERWRQDWAVEYVEEDKPSGRIDWSLVRSPWVGSRHGVLGGGSPLGWPVLGITVLF